MNLPNKLTLSRIIATPVFLFFMMPGWFGQFWGLDKWGRYAAAAIFVVASLTDLLDGMIARKYNLISEFGKFLDPVADKLLVTAALLAFIVTDNLSVWAVFIILFREFIVMGFRVVAVGQGVVIAADKYGKIKTVLQIIATVVILINDFPFSFFTDFPVGMAIMWAAVVMTIVSGVNYLVANAKVLQGAK